MKGASAIAAAAGIALAAWALMRKKQQSAITPETRTALSPITSVGGVPTATPEEVIAALAAAGATTPVTVTIATADGQSMLVELPASSPPAAAQYITVPAGVSTPFLDLMRQRLEETYPTPRSQERQYYYGQAYAAVMGSAEAYNAAYIEKKRLSDANYVDLIGVRDITDVVDEKISLLRNALPEIASYWGIQGVRELMWQYYPDIPPFPQRTTVVSYGYRAIPGSDENETELSISNASQLLQSGETYQLI